MPRHTANRGREKRKLSKRQRAHRHISQVRLVTVNRVQDAARGEPYRCGHPPQIVCGWNQAFASQFRNEAPLQRWKGHQRSVDVEKRSNSARVCFKNAIRHRAVDVSNGLHAVFLTETFATAIFAVVTGAILPAPMLPAMNCQPSTRTGIARTRQNTAVAEVSATAPLRIAACAAGVSPPISATGPRVSASSRPR